MADDTRILYEKRNRIAYVTLNRPEAMNAIDPDMSVRLLEIFTDFRDSDDAWVAIFTGTGDRAFCTGADLKAMGAKSSPKAYGVAFGGITRGFKTWKPIITAVNGYALGGGLELALFSDIRICSENAQFGLPEVRWAIMPNAGDTTRLPRAIPQAIAMKLILTGGRLSAKEALQYGLVSDVVPRDQLIAKAEEIANAILANGPLAVRAVKEAVLRGLDMPVDDALEFSYYLGRFIGTSEDSKEGPKAFAEKRTPNFQAR